MKGKIKEAINKISDNKTLTDIHSYINMNGLQGIKDFEKYLGKYVIVESAGSIAYKTFIQGLDISYITYILDNLELEQFKNLEEVKWNEISDLPKEFIDIIINDTQKSNSVNTGKGESALSILFKGSQNTSALKGDIIINNLSVEIKGRSWMIGKEGNLPDVPKDIRKNFIKIAKEILSLTFPNEKFDLLQAKTKALPTQLYHIKDQLDYRIEQNTTYVILLAILNHIDKDNPNNKRISAFIMETRGSREEHKEVTRLFQQLYLNNYVKEVDYVAVVNPERYQFISSQSIINEEISFGVDMNTTDSSSRGGGYQGRYSDYVTIN